MAACLLPITSADQLALETTSIIAEGRNALAEFRLWASRELRALSAQKARTKILIQDSRKILAGFSTDRLSNRIASTVAPVELDESPRDDRREIVAKAMILYRVHFLTHGDEIFHVQNFLAENDTAAIAHAKREFRSGFGLGFEIWDDDRHFHIERFV